MRVRLPGGNFPEQLRGGFSISMKPMSDQTLTVAALAGYFIYWSLSRRGWETLSGASSEPFEVSKGEIGLQEGD